MRERAPPRAASSLASFRTGVIAPNMFMPLAGHYLSKVDFHVYPMHIAEHTSALNCHPILQAFTVLHHAHGQARMAVTVCVLAARDVAGLMPWWTKGNHEKGTKQQKWSTLPQRLVTPENSSGAATRHPGDVALGRP